jgi:hypothetical protein
LLPRSGGAVLALRGKHATYLPSLYVDVHGEEDCELSRGRPLTLDLDRWKALGNMHATHKVALEVSRRRAGATRVIKDNYY